MKITIVGAGNVGSQVAFYSALRELGEIVLVDVVEGLPQGKALDMLQAMPVVGSNVKIVGTNDYGDTAGSDVVVVTAGIARKPGMSRDDLVAINANIMKAIIPDVVKHSPESILIMVTNPLDAMVRLAYDLSGFPKNRVIGMAGVLDSARFRAFLAQELNADVNDVEAMVLGGHGDLMVPLVGHCKVGGKPIKELLPQEKIDAIVGRVKNGGAEIVGLLKTGSAFFAPGVSIADMIDSIFNDRKRVLPCSVLLEGEYGVDGFFVGVPVVLGKGGAEKVVEMELSGEEKAAFGKSVEHVRELVKKL
ncbi:malate dehydrogenase [Nanoarchaeota archaeon]